MNDLSEVEQYAYINCDNAICRYKPNMDAPACIIPPFFEQVKIVLNCGDWVKISWLGIVAWSPKSQLSNTKPAVRKESQNPVETIFNGFDYGGVPGIPVGGSSFVEYGPRGGRFTRTKTGHRRYF